MRRGIADVVDVGVGDIRLAHEVDVHFRRFLLAGALRNAHRVNEQIRSALRDYEIQILVVLKYRQRVARVVGSYPRVISRHLIEYLVHYVRLDYRFLLLELVCGGGKLHRVLGVDGVPHHYLGYRERVPGIIEHQYLVGVVFVPEDIPVDILLRNVYHRGVVYQPHGPPCVGHGIRVVRVVGGVDEGRHDVAEIRDIVEVQRLQHVLLYHLGYHVVRRDYNVVVGSAALQLCV